jgi:hypothetical protein
VAVAGDAGGANAVAPVVTALQTTEGYRVRGLAYRQARTVWARRGIVFEELSEATTTEDAAQLLREARTALLLTGTSVNGVDLEKRFLAAARLQAVPSLAVLDFWSNYALRFADQDGSLVLLPDRIAIMDEQAREEMSAEGFPANLLAITGQPAFDGLVTCRQQATPARRAAVRAALGVAPDEQMVLFASQPLAAFYGMDTRSSAYPGYTERTVLDTLVPALERITRRRGRRVVLVIRPHPREDAADLQRWRGQVLRIVLSEAGDGREVALASDLVTGMSSMLLVEACLMGCIVVSLQPGLRSADPLPTNRQGLSRALYQESEVEPVLEGLLFDQQARADAVGRLRSDLFIPDAAERVVRLIGSMLATKKAMNREV